MTPFDRFTLSRAVSWAGNALTLVALPVLLYQRTSDPLLTGLLAACEGLPYLLLGLPAGALVDRWGARRTMLVTTALSALVTASVPLAEQWGPLAGTGSATTGTVHLLLVALTTSSLFVFFDAGSFGAVPALVGRDGIGPATARLSGVSTVIGLAGPALAGVLLTVLRPSTVIALDAASYVLSLGLLLTVRWRQPAATGRSVLADIGEGLRHVWAQPLVRTLTFVGVGGSLAGGAVTGLLVVLADARFGLSAGDPRLGLLFAAGPVGALAATVLVTRCQRRFPVGRITLGGWGLATASLLLLASVGNWWSAALALVLWQSASTLAILNAIVVRQTVTPLALQSRVGTTARMIAFGGQPLGAALGGAVASATDVGSALVVAAACTAGAVMGGVAGGLRRTPVLAALASPDAEPAVPSDP